jgi:hypothetical protein
LRIRPDNGVVRAMLLRLLFGPESHQDRRPLAASCKAEHEGRK